MKEVQILDGQTFFDIAAQELGDPQRAFEVAKLNARNLTDLLTPGEFIKVPEIAIDKKNIAKILSTPANKPASATGSQDTGIAINEGVGYWAIGLDFIVT